MNLPFSRIAFIIVFLLFAPPLASQTITPKYIDSLYEVAYQHDLNGNIKEAEAVANTCTILSKKINYRKGILQAKKIYADCKMLTDAEDKTFDNDDDALELFASIVEEAKKAHFNDLAAICLKEMGGLIVSNTSKLGTNPARALNLFNQAEVLNCGKDSLAFLGDIYNSKGVYFDICDSIALTSKYYLSSLNIFRSLKDEYGISKVLYNLCWELFDNGLYKTANFYANENLVLAYKINSATQIFRALGFKIALCRINGQRDSVKYYIAQEKIAAKKFSSFSLINVIQSYHQAILFDYAGKNDSVLYCLNGLMNFYEVADVILDIGSMSVLSFLANGRENEAYKVLNEFKVRMSKLSFDKGGTQLKAKYEHRLSLLTFAYNLYKETKTNSWIPAFKKHIWELPEKTLLLQGQNKVSEIIGFDENFAKADYLVAQAEIKAQEVEIKLKEKRMAYLVTFFIVAVVLLALLLFFFTKIRRLMAQEGRTNEQLAQNNSYLQMYDRAIGHDLASPLALINDCAQTLRDGKNDEAFRQQLLDGIYEHSVLALRQVRGLLRLGISSDSAQQVALSTQLLPLVQESQRLAGVFGNPVRVQGAEDLPLVLMNADALKQIFQNLFSNSLKHSGRGKAVEIEVKGEYKPKSKFCTITISDNGNGINSSACASIFDLGTTSNTTPSTGLGLAICKVLMDKFGGSIEYQDGQGAGSSFVLKVKVV